MTSECKHSDKIILCNGDQDHIARETWCSKCGYYSSCHKCGVRVFTTELCILHRNLLSRLTHSARFIQVNF